MNELEQVSISETNLRESMVQLNASTADMKETSATLHEWVEKETTFAEAVERLIESLKEIEELRTNADGFWTDVKEHMSEGGGHQDGSEQ
ncbi:MAG: hypothetical protein IPH60_14885 [Flavobacteriales bacterium]|nr:hypothetical protein [Flavobacteriales bacterium]